MVGYVQKEQLDGAFSRTACFDGVATEAMDIQEIVPAFPEGEELYTGGVQIMTLTAGTETDATYIYMTATDAKEVDGIEKAGWFNMDMDTRLTGAKAVTFDPGEGFLVISSRLFSFRTAASHASNSNSFSVSSAPRRYCSVTSVPTTDTTRSPCRSEGGLGVGNPPSCSGQTGMRVCVLASSAIPG